MSAVQTLQVVFRVHVKWRFVLRVEAQLTSRYVLKQSVQYRLRDKCRYVVLRFQPSAAFEFEDSKKSRNVLGVELSRIDGDRFISQPSYRTFDRPIESVTLVQIDLGLGSTCRHRDS